MKKLFGKLFKGESEFTKKWIARFTIIIFTLLLFYIILAEELLLCHFKLGLSYNMCKMLFSNYGEVVKVAITGYSVTFIGSMAKAFMAKQAEEANKVKLQINSLSCENTSEEEEEIIEEDE